MTTDKQIRIKCHDIIEINCKGCQNELLENVHCLKCPFYKQLTDLGALLVRDESDRGVPVRKFFLTAEDYKVMKHEKEMFNREIAKEIGVSLALLSTYISKWRKEGKL